jgi:hypothetical protein
MDCPHCGIAFHDSWKTTNPLVIGKDLPNSGWAAHMTECPACKNVTIDLIMVSLSKGPSGVVTTGVLQRLRVYPTNIFRKPTPIEIPADIREDYEEACKVSPLSPKASAALSRRCLQAVLREQGYTQRDLVQQVNALLDETGPTKAIPTALRETVDVIRNFGNFSAHRITDQTTLQIIPVEPEEAEWCLDILEDMFDHYYVKPAQAKARKAELNAKLTAAGKPPSR